MQSSTSQDLLRNLAASKQQQAAQTKAAVSHRGDDRLSFAETGLLFAALATLLCSMLLNVIVP